MPKVSVVIPVYKAEGMLRRCVESIIFGEETDLEVILIEDCSPDGSWNLCQQLALEYSRVICLQNDQNRGVSYTRNRGMDVATGKYLLFVDSDDWVSGKYVKTMIDAAEENPGKMIACGFTFIDHIRRDRVTYGIYDTPTLPRSDFVKLVNAVMLQQLWNKVFCLDEIRKVKVRFNETICMGEDYQFVMDLIEALDYKECVIIDQPLYYYVRYTSGSLMNSWAKYETYDEALKRQLRSDQICGVTESKLDEFNRSYAYRIVRESNLPRKQKLEVVQSILGSKKGKLFYFIQQLQAIRAKLRMAVRSLLEYRRRLLAKCRSLKNKSTIRKATQLLRQNEISVISQNCIGGVFSHDMGQEFRSPTINLYITAADFIKFVNNLEHYLAADLMLRWGEEYPIGKVDDVELQFMHYDTCQQARDAWERRKKRVNLSRVLVLSTDRDGFDDGAFEQWKMISYPKLLFTAQERYAGHPDTLYFPQYKANGCVPDLVPKREFYRDQLLINKANTVGSSR